MRRIETNTTYFFENELSELKRIIFFNFGQNTLLSLFSLLTTFENELREFEANN